MRIIYFTRDYSPHDHRFLQALSETQHQVYSLRLERRSRTVEERPVPAGIREIEWRGGRGVIRGFTWISLLLDLRRILNDIQPDVVHAGSIQTASFLTALAGFHPLVSMSWGSDLLKDANRNLWLNAVTRFTLDHSTVLVGDCQAVSQKAQMLGFPVDRIVLFPWGVDLQHFEPGRMSDWRIRQGWENHFVILCLRAWEPLYGVDVVARAFVKASQEVSDLRLILLGGGSQADLIRKILVDGGVLERVHFGGQIGNQELPDYYRAADLYVSASHSDGSSVSLMEALACGLPGLVSDIPGNREWITAENEGWLFPDGDDAALANGIIRAARQRNQVGNMRKKARELAETRADWPRNFQKLLGAYDLALRIQKKGKSHA